MNEPAIEEWIKEKAKSFESLLSFYTKHFRRIDCYREITQKIIGDLKSYKNICVILYGHPTVFAMPALAAAKLAVKEGLNVTILPGISAENCLFADLMIDPGSNGSQSYEATDFIIRDKIIDVTSHLILWQVGTIGEIGRPCKNNNKKGINLLTNKLIELYSFSHKAIIYEAALYPHFKPRVELISIDGLREVELTSLSTLYIPPLREANINRVLLEELGISVEELK